MNYYKINITVLTSVFIGSGEEIQKYEYIDDKKSDFIRIINQKKLIELLGKNYDRYLELIANLHAYKNNQAASLYDFLVNLRLYHYAIDSLTEYKINKGIELGSFCRIKTFVKDHNNQPYVPGSSIKGMLINSISSGIDQDNKKIDIQKISSAISVSDSKPISTDNLMLNKVLRYNYKKKKISELNEYIEILKPKTEIKSILSLDEKIINIDEIKEYLKTTYSAYYKYYLSKFYNLSKNGGAEIVFAKSDGIISYLGAYTGYPTKTTIYPTHKEQAPQEAEKQLLIKEKDKEKEKDNDKAKNDVFPLCLKCTQINGKLQENGAIEIAFEKIDLKVNK